MLANQGCNAHALLSKIFNLFCIVIDEWDSAFWTFCTHQSPLIYLVPWRVYAFTKQRKMLPFSTFFAHFDLLFVFFKGSSIVQILAWFLVQNSIDFSSGRLVRPTKKVLTFKCWWRIFDTARLVDEKTEIFYSTMKFKERSSPSCLFMNTRPCSSSFYQFFTTSSSLSRLFYW